MYQWCYGKTAPSAHAEKSKRSSRHGQRSLDTAQTMCIQRIYWIWDFDNDKHRRFFSASFKITSSPSHWVLAVPPICLHNESMNYEERHVTFYKLRYSSTHGFTLETWWYYVLSSNGHWWSDSAAMWLRKWYGSPRGVGIQDVHYGFKFPINYAPGSTATGCIRGKLTFPKGERNGDSTKKRRSLGLCLGLRN